MAREVAKEEQLSEQQCSFYQVDASINPEQLLAGKLKAQLFHLHQFVTSNHLTPPNAKKTTIPLRRSSRPLP